MNILLQLTDIASSMAPYILLLGPFCTTSSERRQTPQNQNRVSDAHAHYEELRNEPRENPKNIIMTGHDTEGEMLFFGNNYS